MKRFFIFLLFIFSFSSIFSEDAHGHKEEKVVKTGSVSAVYITGIGCPNCAKTDPVILKETLNKIPELYVVEYEIYKQKEFNRDFALKYFDSFFPDESHAVPALIVNGEYRDMGKWNVFALAEDMELLKEAPFPHLDGKTYQKFEELDITKLPGKPKIWHLNRALVKVGDGGNNDTLKKLLTSKDVDKILKTLKYKKLDQKEIQVSKSRIAFDNAVQIDGWKFFWRKAKSKFVKPPKGLTDIMQGKQVVIKEDNVFNPFGIAALILGIVLMIFYLIDRHNLRKSGNLPGFTEKQKNLIVVGLSIAFLAGFFAVAKIVSPEFLKEMGYTLPLPVFTFMIAVVDGFNPCNMFVLTFLLALMVSVSHSRLRIYTVGYTFVAVVYVIYFLFMAAWLNIFKYIGFIDPLRISIAVIALVAGFINCKELFFFKQGVSLTTSDKGASFLQKKARDMKETIKNGTMPMLIISSIVLAFFASLIELPCTAGFPIVYTSILSGMEIANGTFFYYFWIAIYNLCYVIPLVVIIGIFGYTFRGKAISEKTVQRIKFIGGFIMILLGIVLLVNPQMIGIGM